MFEDLLQIIMIKILIIMGIINNQVKTNTWYEHQRGASSAAVAVAAVTTSSNSNSSRSRSRSRSIGAMR